MNDILPGTTAHWHHVERCIRAVLDEYGYAEIRLPLLEKTELFSRSIGEVTDIVEKEMYTFEDRNGTSLTLRPEGTAGCVRAAISHGLLHNQTQRVWYAGPMFRYERPQKGRYRQFHQIGAEAYGFGGPDIDAELILLSARLWKALGVEHVRLQLNSLGTPEARQHYRAVLVDYFSAHVDRLDTDSRRRLELNPLRILDSKNPELTALISAAPSLLDHLDPESEAHFSGLRELLDAAGVEYDINPRLVRGLDYYSRTVFEWVTDRLGAQDAICSGGRYDPLIEQLGGRPTPAIGWALGLERLVALLEDQHKLPAPPAPHAYLVTVGEQAGHRGLVLAESLRDAVPGLRLTVNCGGGSFKSQFKRADRSGAEIALIMGEEEVERGTIGFKFLRRDEAQVEVQINQLAAKLADVVSA